MPKISIKRSIKINASPEKVFNIINDFNHWSIWSPWLIMEPEVKVTVADDAKYYEWNGKRVGSGNMTITSEKENESVYYDLIFLKPWKSKAKVSFELKADGKATDVSWTMDSSLPFFMFWMKKMMMAFISMDYDRGLNMLKDYVEDGKVHSKLSFLGENSFEEISYIGIRTMTNKQNMGPQMGSDFDKLEEFLKDQPDLANGKVFSIYHKWDMVKNRVDYSACVQVKSIPSELPEGMISGQIAAGKAYQIEHKGPYAHLGNAWTTLYGMQRGKEFKVNKKVNPFEVYNNKPGDVKDRDLSVTVNFVLQ